MCTGCVEKRRPGNVMGAYLPSFLIAYPALFPYEAAIDVSFGLAKADHLRTT